MSEFRISVSNEELVARIQAGESGLLTQLWEQTRKFAIKVAQPFAKQCGDPSQTVEDLMQEAYFALLAAIPKYRRGGGAAFTSVYHFYLLRRFNSWMAENSGPVSIPTYLRERQRAMLRKESELASQGDECIQSTAEALGISADRVQSMKDVLRSVAGVSLDGPIGGADTDDMSLKDVIASTEDLEQACIDREYAKERQLIVWEIAQRYCSEREYTVLSLYYIDNLKITDIAERFGVSTTNIANIRNQAVKRLRRSKAARDLTERLEMADCCAYGRGRGISGNSWTSSTENAALKRIDATERIIGRMQRDDDLKLTYMLMP
jgi:RNA polymerase sigma factor for flagellar operon FliA